MVESMQQSSATPKNRDVGRGLRKIVACSQPYLAVASCIYSFWHGVIPTSYFIFNDFYTCFTHFYLTVSISTNRGLPSWMGYTCRYRSCAPYIIYAHALALSAKIRMREIELLTRKMRKLSDLTKSPSERYTLSVCIKGSCTTCIQVALYNFMACSCPNFVLGRLRRRKRGENRGFSVFRI